MCVLLPILRFKPRYGLRRQPNVQADLCSNRRFRCSARRCVTCGIRASDTCGAKPRAGKQTRSPGGAAALASYAYERLDGSGYFRGVRVPALSLEARVLAASLAWVALRSPRPWRASMTDEAAIQIMMFRNFQSRSSAMTPSVM